MKSSISRKREQSASQLRSRAPKRAAGKVVHLAEALARRAEGEARKRQVSLEALVATALETVMAKPDDFIAKIDTFNDRMARKRGYKPLQDAYNFTKDELHERNDVP